MATAALTCCGLAPAGFLGADMDTTTSIKMTTLAIQNLFGYVEEENLAALKAHLDRFKEVDGRSDVRAAVLLSRACQTCPHVLLFVPDRMDRLRSCWRRSKAAWRSSRSSSGEEPTSTWTTW